MRLFDKLDQDSEEVEIKQGSKSRNEESKLKQDVETKLDTTGSSVSSTGSESSSDISELKKQNEKILEKLNKVLDKLDDESEKGDMNGVL